jgi:hypothetical protein
MPDTHQGSCFCGAVAIEATGQPIDMGYCHCNSCRLYAGAPVSGFTLWQAGNVKITKGEALLGRFHKTEFSGRRFCTQCGGHVMVDHPGLGLVDIHASTLPSVAFKPTVHLHYAETVLPMKDGLPKLKDFPRRDRRLRRGRPRIIGASGSRSGSPPSAPRPRSVAGRARRRRSSRHRPRVLRC